MLNTTYSVYYGTKFEQKLWSSLEEQQQAFLWQNSVWRDRIEGSIPFQIADSTDMSANPYRRYCNKYSLLLGTEIKSVSKIKYNIAVLITAATEPLKHTAGAIESFIRCFFSTCFICITPLHRICPSRINTIASAIKKEIQSPKQNLNYLIKNVIEACFYTLFSSVLCYQHWNTLNIGGLFKDMSRKLEAMSNN